MPKSIAGKSLRRRIAKNIAIAAIATCMMSNPAFSEETVKVDELINRSDTAAPTLDSLYEKTLEFKDGTSAYNENGSVYSLTETDKGAGEANVITKTLFDVENQSATTKNYEINVAPELTGAGSSSVITDIINGGIFTTYYDKTGSRAALNPGKTAGSFIRQIYGNSINSFGAAFVNQGNLGIFGGTYIGNHAESYGGSVLFNFNGTVDTISGIFIGNDTTSSFGGALLNYGGKFGNIEGYFLGNTSSQYGGAISLASGGTIDAIIGDFIGNKAPNGGAIFVYDKSKSGLFLEILSAIKERTAAQFISQTAVA